MSVLIRGMEMPTSCHSCPMCLMRFCQAGDRELSERETRPNAKRPEDCPLLPVSPHGRLIDADANLAVMMRVLDAPYTGHGTIDTAMLKACIKMFEEAPTIIPADKEGAG